MPKDRKSFKTPIKIFVLVLCFFTAFLFFNSIYQKNSACALCSFFSRETSENLFKEKQSLNNDLESLNCEKEAMLYIEKAHFFLNNKKEKEALEMYRRVYARAVNLRKTSVVRILATHGLVNALLANGLRAETLNTLETILNNNWNILKDLMLWKYSELLIESGRSKEAAIPLRQLIDLFPDSDFANDAKWQLAYITETPPKT